MILHIDPEKVWQGGQRQVVYLVERLNRAGYKSHIACRVDSLMAKHCHENDIPFSEYNFRSKINPQTINKLLSFCRQKKVRIIHCHSSHALTLGLQIKLFLPKLKLVASRRVDFHIASKISGKFKYKNPLLNKLVCISQNIMNICLSDAIPEDKLRLIYSGIELDRLANQIPPINFIKDEHLPKHDFLIGTIAALVHHKDYPTLIKAAKIVLQIHPNTLFVSLGKGVLLNDLKKMTVENGIEERFRFLGFRQEVGYFMNSFDIFTLSSKFEGLGTSVLDALACGKACACTKGGGIPEMINDNENGLLVPVKDHEKLAEAFCYLIENSAERKRLGKAARKSVEKFSVDNTAQEHIKLYKELLGERL